MIWGVLVALQLQLVPGLRYGWALNFWQYLPSGLAWALALATLALCFEPVRARLVRAGELALEPLAAMPRPIGEALLAASTTAALWLVREQKLFGDSEILLWASVGSERFHIPEIGATFLFGTLVRFGHALGLEQQATLELLRAAICVSGGLTVVFVARAARYLAPGLPAAATVFLLSGGLLRIFAGHVEVYAFLFVAVSAYAWAALAFVSGRCPFWLPCLALGIAVWLHLAALCLAPALALLPQLAGRTEATGGWLRQLATGGAIAIAPSLLFLALVPLVGDPADLERAWAFLLHILDIEPSAEPAAVHFWVRAPGSVYTGGTHYVALGAPQLKYVANAAWVLAPAALPVLLTSAVRRPRAFTATPEARFALVSAAPLVLYAFTLRAVWGPYDWDLFSVTGFFLAALATHMLATQTTRETGRDLFAWLAGSSLLFVGLPFLLMGAGTPADAGPFSDRFDTRMIDVRSPDHQVIAPWL